MFEHFEENFRRVRERIAVACARAGRSDGEVTVIAVTKGHPFAAMETALRSGVHELGENRVQEALPKLDRLPPTARVHLIGHLQTNKVNKVVGRFASVQSVDRADLLDKIARRAESLGVAQPVWIQVNVSKEEQKGGCEPAAAAELWEAGRAAHSLELLGLMAMARFDASEGELRRSFGLLRRLGEHLRRADGSPPALSMGMSDDYEIAVEEGATHLRLGTVLFGPRS